MALNTGMDTSEAPPTKQRNDDPPPPPKPKPAGKGLPLKLLCEKHSGDEDDEYDAKYWRRLRALYAGGKKLLKNHELMVELFPPHRQEHVSVYAERVARAFYMPYAAEIIDHIVASLTAMPVSLTLAAKGEGDAPPNPPYWEDFMEDLSPEGGEKCSLQRLLHDQIQEALIVRCAWTLLEMPKRKSSAEYSNILEQQKDRALDVYAVPVKAECVFDWEYAPDGELAWAVMHVEERRRESIDTTRNMVTRRWTYYDRSEWRIYEITFPEKKEPNEKAIIPEVARGAHPFGKVPLVRMVLPDGLWAMNKLEGLAREHFNKRSALSWAEYQHLFQELYEFLEAQVSNGGVSVDGAGSSPSRGTDQERGQGFVQVRSAGDKAEFIGPDPGSFGHGIVTCNNTRDEMHRVTHQMSLSVDNTSAAMQRSGMSKAHDRAAQAVVLTALGEIIRDHAELVMDMAAAARQDRELVGQWRAAGADKFDQKNASDAVEEAVNMATVTVPSPTFMRLYFFQLAKATLGPNVTIEELKTIREELEDNIPDEMMPVTPGAPLPVDDQLDEGADENPPPPKAVPKPGRATVFATGGMGK